MDGSISPDEVAIMLNELKKLGYSHDLALTSIHYSRGDIRTAVKYCYNKHNHLGENEEPPHNEKLQEIIYTIEHERAAVSSAATGDGLVRNEQISEVGGEADHPDDPPPIPSLECHITTTPRPIAKQSDPSSDNVVFDELTPKSEINRKYEFEIEVLLGRQQTLKKQLRDFEMEYTRMLNQHSTELEKAEKQGRQSAREEIAQLRMEIASLAEKIVTNEKEYNDSISLLVDSSSKQVFSLQEDLARYQNLCKQAEADRDEARALESFTVERNKQLYAQISRSSSNDGKGSNNPHFPVGSCHRTNSSSSPQSSPHNRGVESGGIKSVYNTSHHQFHDERDRSEVVHAMENIISNVIWFDGVELVYQNHCEAMIATEAQKNEELERLLVAQKSIVVSSRERIRALEGEVEEKVLEISGLKKQTSSVSAMEVELSVSKKQIVELNNKLDSAQGSLSSKEADMESLKKEIDRLNRDKNRLNGDIEEKLSELHATQLMLESNKQQSTLAQTQASQALKELTVLREKEGEISKDNVIMKAEIDKLKAQASMASARLEALQKQNEEYASQIDAASDVEIGHSSEMLKLRNRISELTSLNSAQSRELSDIEENYQQRLKQQSEDHRKTIEKLRDECIEKEKIFAEERDQLKATAKDLKEITSVHELEIDDLKQQHAKELEKATCKSADTYSELHRAHSLELSRLRQKITEFNTQAALHQQELTAADKAYELKLSTLKIDFNDKVERIKREKEDELSDMREKLNEEIYNLTKDREALRSEVEELKATVKMKDVTSLGAQDDLEKERERNAIEVDNLNKSYIVEIEKLREAVTAQHKVVEESKESYKRQLEDLKKIHANELDELKVAVEASKGELQTALESTEASLRNSQEEVDILKMEIAAADQKLTDDTINSIRDDYNEKIKTMNDGFIRREEEHKKELVDAVAQEKLTHVVRIDELEAALATANNNVEDQIDQHTTKIRATLQEDKEKALQALQTECQNTIEKANEERDEFKLLFTKENKLRKIIHNKLMDLQGNIRVICRVRPVLENEKKSGQDLIVTEFLSEEDLIITKDSTCKIKFEFDQCFTSESSQMEVFKAVQPLCISVLDGYNICIFAYGQTGSGKTFTMDGNQGEQRGIIQRTVIELFDIAKQNPAIAYTFKITMLEIYNETIRDLLLTKGDRSNGDARLDIRHSEKGSSVMGLTEVQVAVPDHVFEILERGRCNRAVGAHDMNEHSSRSHSIFTIMCTTRNTIDDSGTFGKLNLIDLAGSERLSKTEATGDRLKEAQSINKSLSALGDVINALGNKKNTHIPYRNSKLTYLLQDSLGGNSKVMMVVTISPASYNVGETICSLNFASRCRLTELGRAVKQLIETGRGEDDSSFSSPLSSSAASNGDRDRDAQTLMSTRRELKKKSTLGAFSR